MSRPIEQSLEHNGPGWGTVGLLLITLPSFVLTVVRASVPGFAPGLYRTTFVAMLVAMGLALAVTVALKRGLLSNCARAELEVAGSLAEVMTALLAALPHATPLSAHELTLGPRRPWLPFGERMLIRLVPADGGCRLIMTSSSRSVLPGRRRSVRARRLARELDRIEASLAKMKLASRALVPAGRRDIALLRQRAETGTVWWTNQAWTFGVVLVLTTPWAELAKRPALTALTGLASSVLWSAVGSVVIGAWVYVAQRNSLVDRAESLLVVNLAAEQALVVVSEALGPRARRESPLVLHLQREGWWSWVEGSVRFEVVDAGACRVIVASWSSLVTIWQASAHTLTEVLGKIEGPLLTAVAVRASSLAAERVRHQETEVRLSRLQAQVEAHFLYNTLAHVGVLIGRDPPSAQRMLDELVDFLRASSKVLTAVGTSLSDEVRLAERYLALMRHRLGGRLSAEVRMEPRLAGTPCLPGVLLTLVENAVKHGIEPSAAGGRISVSAAEEGGEVTLAVADTGVGFQSEGGTGTGLSNLKERLFTRYGARARLQLERGRESGVVSTVVFPADAGEA